MGHLYNMMPTALEKDAYLLTQNLTLTLSEVVTLFLRFNKIILKQNLHLENNNNN